MANLLGQLILSQEPCVDGWPDKHKFEVVIAEGEMDHLVWSIHAERCCDAPIAVFGVSAGSWSQDIANRIPARTPVVVRTHHDASGDKYANTIFETLPTRCDVRRSRKAN